VPSGSSALIQTNGYPSKCAGHPGCNNQTISGLIMQGGIAFAPPSGQTLQVLDSGASPTTPQSNGMLVTGTVNASTTIGSSVTLFSNGAPTSIMVQNNSLFLNGAISSNSSTVGGFNNWRVIQIGGSGGTLTIDRNDFSDPNGGTINATGIPSTTIPDAPGGPGVFIGNGATSLTFNQSLTINLNPPGPSSPQGFAFIIAQGSTTGPLTLAANVNITVHGGCSLCSGTLSSGQSYAFFPVSLVA